MTTFEDLGIKKSILDGLKEIGFKEAFPIQEAAVPVLLSGRDVVGQAHTGTGKTAAYSISMLQQITPKLGIQGLIIAPTRELAIQITNEIRKFGKFTGIKSATIYGGQGMGIQLDALEKGVEIVVATPGRLIDHLKRGSITLEDVSHLVLDEADSMLDMGFIDVMFQRGRLFFPVAYGAQLLTGRAKQTHELSHADGTAFAQSQIVLSRAAFIGMPFQGNCGAEILRQILGVRLEYRSILIEDDALVEIEVHGTFREQAVGIIQRVARPGRARTRGARRGTSGRR